MDDYPKTMAEKWERFGHLRGRHDGGTFSIGYLKTDRNQSGAKLFPLAPNAQVTVEERQGFWVVYSPAYCTTIQDREVFERYISKTPVKHMK